MAAAPIVIVGMGARGSAWATEVRSHPGFELAGCVDVDPTALERGGDAVAKARRFTRLEDALDAVRCEATIVATPEDRHVEPTREALARGCAVLVEKPFTTRLEDAVSLVRAAEHGKVPLLVGQQYRYLRFQRAARRVVEEGGIGRIGMAVAHYYHGSDHLRPYHAKMTDSVLWGPVVHHLDALRYVVAEPITGVLAQTFKMPWSAGPGGATMQALLTLGGGIHATYSASYESSGHEFLEGGQEYYQRFVGEDGTLHAFHRRLILCRRGKWPSVIRRGRRGATEELRVLDELRRALDGGDTPGVSGRDNLGTVAALEACVRSSEERRWVDPRELLAAAAGEAGTG